MSISSNDLSDHIKLFLLFYFLNILLISLIESSFGDLDRHKRAWKESNLFLKLSGFYILKYDGIKLLAMVPSTVCYHLIGILSIIGLFLFPTHPKIISIAHILNFTLFLLDLAIPIFIPTADEIKKKKPREKGRVKTKEEKLKIKNKKKKDKKKRHKR